MEISEIFYSIQGEGPNIGKRSIFIRTAGCNLSCKFCDTKYSYKGKNFTREEIINIVKDISKRYNTNQIVWTGGEPTLQIKELGLA